MAAKKSGIGQHSRLTRRARHLIALLRRTRVHSVRQAILRELAHEFNRIRGGARKAARTARRKGESLGARAARFAHHLGNRVRHGATFYDHDGREIRGGQHGQRAYTLRHHREADAPPQAREGKRDERTPREKLRANLGDRLEAMGHEIPGPARREPAHARGKDHAEADARRPSPAGRDAGPETSARREPRPSPERESASRRRADAWDGTYRQEQAPAARNDEPRDHDAGWFSGQWREDHLVDSRPVREDRTAPEPRTELSEPYDQPARTDARLDPAGGPPLPSEDIGRARPARDSNSRPARAGR